MSHDPTASPRFAPPTSGPALAVLGLGSNLGDRYAFLREATRQIGHIPSLDILRRSSIFASRALGPPQPDFLNAALLVRLRPDARRARQFLERTKLIEVALGRARVHLKVWGPRTIDIDWLWVEGLKQQQGDLMLPHPRLHNRPFACRPFWEVAPRAAATLNLPAASTGLRRVTFL